MKKTLIRPLTAGFALALATGFSGSVFAASTTEPAVQPAVESMPHAGKPGKGPHGKPGARHEMMRDGLFIPGLGPIPKAQVDALKLTADQQKLVDDLRASQQAAHEKMRTEHDARRSTLQSQLAANKLDPRALIKASDDARDARRDDAQTFEKKGLAIWDSLNDTQRGQITTFMKARQDKMAERRARHERGATPAATPAAAPSAS